MASPNKSLYFSKIKRSIAFLALGFSNLFERMSLVMTHYRGVIKLFAVWIARKKRRCHNCNVVCSHIARNCKKRKQHFSRCLNCDNFCPTSDRHAIGCENTTFISQQLFTLCYHCNKETDHVSRDCPRCSQNQPNVYSGRGSPMVRDANQLPSCSASSAVPEPNANVRGLNEDMRILGNCSSNVSIFKF